jgi:hypothetical protein
MGVPQGGEPSFEGCRQRDNRRSTIDRAIGEGD